MKTGKRELTSGSLLAGIVYFALPYLLSYFLQTLYGMADLFITGQFYDVDGITAVSNGSQVMYMLTVILVGLAMGATVTIGRAVGAKREKEASTAIGNTITLFLFLAGVLTVILFFLVPKIVRLIGTPEEAMAGTNAYLRICVIGIPFITAYNIISSIFRGMGDSRTPMYFIAIACVANILLDYLFIGACSMGPAGAALGTTLAQTLSVFIAVIVIRRKKMGISLTRQDFVPQKTILREILTTGIPVAVQDGCIQIAFMIITVIANHRGLDDAAAVGIVEKVISALFIVPSSMLATVSALSAQNFGAGKPKRAAGILRYATVITCVYGLIVTVVAEFTAERILGIFTADAIVILAGSQYIRGYILDTIVAGIHFSFSGFFCACEKSYIGFLHNMLAIVLIRVPGSYFASILFPDMLFPMGLAAPAGSLLSVIICIAAYRWLKRQGVIPDR